MGIVAIAFTSCQNNDKVLAQVNEAQLTESQARLFMEEVGLDFSSKEEKKQFALDWINRQVFLEELNKTSPSKADLVTVKADQYKSELAKYYIEQDFILQELDTIVKQEELESYFEEHKTDFTLNDYIVKALYLKIPKGLDLSETSIKSDYLLKNDKDPLEVISFAKLYAENFFYNDTTWTYFSEISKDIPQTKYNKDNVVLNRTKTYFSDDQYTYFLNIIDFKLSDAVPPLDFVKDQIREVIVMNRLQKLKEKNASKWLQTIKKKNEIKLNI